MHDFFKIPSLVIASTILLTVGRLNFDILATSGFELLNAMCFSKLIFLHFQIASFRDILKVSVASEDDSDSENEEPIKVQVSKKLKFEDYYEVQEEIGRYSIFFLAVHFCKLILDRQSYLLSS